MCSIRATIAIDNFLVHSLRFMASPLGLKNFMGSATATASCLAFLVLGKSL